MKEEKKWDISKIINDPDLRFYFMTPYHRNGLTIAIPENMKKIHQKKGEKQ